MSATKGLGMDTITLHARTDAEGTLRLDVPTGHTNTEVEVVLVIQPRPEVAAAGSPEARGWPGGFFERTYGCHADDPIRRPSQPDYDAREESS